MNRIFTKDSKMNRIFTKDLNRKISSSSVHSMSKDVANAESSHAAKLHELKKFGSNESNSENLQKCSMKLRIRKPPSGRPRLNVKCPKKTGELYDDEEDLLNAALSVHSAREHACSNTFWKKMEPFFTPVTTKDLLFLKSALHSAGDFNQSQSQDVYKLACSSKGEYNSLNEQCAKFFEDLGIGNIPSAVPSLFQRMISAIIVEDEGNDLYSPDEGINAPLIRGSSHLDDCNFKDKESVESKLDSQLHMCFMDEIFSSIKSASSNTDKNESMSSFFSSNDHLQSDDALLYSDKGFLNMSGEIDAGSQHSSQVMSSCDNQYQLPPLDDRVLQELRKIGVCTETMLHSEDEEGVYQEIKKLEELQRHQAVKVKNYLDIIDKAVQSAEYLEKRNTEELALDQLTAMAYRRTMGGRRVHSMLRKDDQALLQRTLARCKEFEDTGTSCFGQPNLQGVLFSAPSPVKETKAVQGKNLTIGSSSKSRKRHRKNGAGGSVRRPTNTSRKKLQLGSSSSKQALPRSSKGKSIKSKPSSRMEPEPKRIRLSRAATRKRETLGQQSKD